MRSPPQCHAENGQLMSVISYRGSGEISFQGGWKVFPRCSRNTSLPYGEDRVCPQSGIKGLTGDTGGFSCGREGVGRGAFEI
jgi:hypothetical protein